MTTLTKPETDTTGQQLLDGAFRIANEINASDIHLITGQPVFFRVAGVLQPATAPELTDPLTLSSLHQISEQILSPNMKSRFEQRSAVDGALTSPAGDRFRFNIYRANEKLSVAFRKLDNHFYALSELGLDERLYQLCNLKDGLVLIAGPTGSGKSTTLATLINYINENRKSHIITIEDPVEFIHRPNQSLINQRQIGIDTPDFHTALVDSVRQDPDVILVGEIRDLNTIRTAITAAETGHLVFASVHASDCKSAIERLVSVFPGIEQSTIQHLLAATLRAVISQHLLIRHHSVNGATADSAKPNRVLASEVLRVNTAAANLIASNQLNQLQTVLETGMSEGMYTLDHCLAKLVKRRFITAASAKSLARNPAMIDDLARTI